MRRTGGSRVAQTGAHGVRDPFTDGSATTADAQAPNRAWTNSLREETLVGHPIGAEEGHAREKSRRGSAVMYI